MNEAECIAEALEAQADDLEAREERLREWARQLAVFRIDLKEQARRTGRALRTAVGDIESLASMPLHLPEVDS